jgi:hypothetical protein
VDEVTIDELIAQLAAERAAHAETRIKLDIEAKSALLCNDTLYAEREAHAETRREVERLNGIVIPHARKQENANGFQRGWHAALARLREGDSLDVLTALVPGKVDFYGEPE